MPASGWRRSEVVSQEPETRLGVPPEPWPDIPPGYVFGVEWGPVGTLYLFSEDEVISRMASHGHYGPYWLEWIIRRLGAFADGSGSWRVPLRYARAQIHANLSSTEELIHSLAYRLIGDDSTEITPDDLHALAVAIGDQLGDWLTGDTKAYFSQSLSYDSISISYLEQTTPGGSSGGSGDLHTLIPTITYDLPAALPGGAAPPALPFEVALALTLQTDTKGPSYRGRTYLGGLATGVLAGDGSGTFDATKVQTIAAGWGTTVIDGIFQAGTWQAQVVSRAKGTARAIQGIAVGVVPDAQRRRRQSQSESYAQAWGNAPTKVLPS